MATLVYVQKGSLIFFCIVLSFLFCSPIAAQEAEKNTQTAIDIPQRTFRTRNIRIYYNVDDLSGIESRSLYLTKDGGKTWTKTKDEYTEWLETPHGPAVVYHAQADGTYGFAFRFQDIIGTSQSQLQSNDQPELIAIVDTSPALQPILLQPQNTEEWVGGHVYVIQWMTADIASQTPTATESIQRVSEYLSKQSTALYYSIDHAEWTAITRGLDNLGFYRWVVPAKATSSLRIRVSVKDKNGKELFSDPSASITVKVEHQPDILAAKKHFYRATLLKAQQKLDHAIISYEKALLLWDSYPQALNDIAVVYYEKDDFGKALEYFLRSRDVNHGNSEIVAHIGFTLFKLGLLQESLTELRNSVNLDISSPLLKQKVAKALLVLARQFDMDKNKTEALSACEAIIRLASHDNEIESETRLIIERNKTTNKIDKGTDILPQTRLNTPARSRMTF